MRSIGIKSDELNEYVKKNLDLCTPKLSEVSIIASGFDVPEDFEYASFLASMPSRIDDMSVETIRLSSWITSSVIMIEDDDKSLSLAAENMREPYSQIDIETPYQDKELDEENDNPMLESESTIGQNPTIDYELYLDAINESIGELEKELEPLNDKLYSLRLKCVQAQRSRTSTESIQIEIDELERQVEIIRGQMRELEITKNSVEDILSYNNYLALMDNADFVQLSSLPEDFDIDNFLNNMPIYGTNEEYIAYFNDNPQIFFAIFALQNGGVEDINRGEEIKSQLVNTLGLGLYLELSKAYDWLLVNVDYMKPEDLKIFMYLANTQGRDAAMEFANSIQEEINSLIGCEAAQKRIEEFEKIVSSSGVVDACEYLGIKLTEEQIETINNLPQKDAINYLIMNGLFDGLGTFFEGIANVLGSADGIISSEQFEKMYFLNYLAEKYEEYGFTKALYTGVYNISSSIGNMVPSIIASVVSNYIIPGSGAIIGSALMGVSAAGNALESGLQSGMSYRDAVLYGVIIGLSESTLQYFIGGIMGLSKNVGIASLKDFAIDLFKEGLEEGIQSYIEQCLYANFCHQPLYLDWSEIGVSALYGILTAGIMNGGSIVINNVINGVNYGIRLTVEEIENLINSNDSEIISSAIMAQGYINDFYENSTMNNVDFDLTNPLIKQLLLDFNNAMKSGDTNSAINCLFALGEDVAAYNLLASTEMQSDSEFIDIINRINNENVSSIDELVQTEKGIELAKDLARYFISTENEFLNDLLNNPTLNVGKNYYSTAAYVGKIFNIVFATYCDHTIPHVENVATTSVEATQIFLDYLYNNPNACSLYGQDVNEFEVYIASLLHDVGMSGLWNIPEFRGFNYDETDGGSLRKAHSQGSGVIVLSEAEAIQAFAADLGIEVDVNKIAILVYCHSKSAINKMAISDPKFWNTTYENFNRDINSYNKAVDEYNLNHPDSPMSRISLDISLDELQNDVNLNTMVYMLRLGDAFAPKTELTQGQYKVEEVIGTFRDIIGYEISGNNIKITYADGNIEIFPVEFKTKMKDGKQVSEYYLTVDGVKYKIGKANDMDGINSSDVTKFLEVVDAAIKVSGLDEVVLTDDIMGKYYYTTENSERLSLDLKIIAVDGVSTAVVVVNGENIPLIPGVDLNNITQDMIIDAINNRGIDLKWGDPYSVKLWTESLAMGVNFVYGENNWNSEMSTKQHLNPLTNQYEKMFCIDVNVNSLEGGASTMFTIDERIGEMQTAADIIEGSFHQVLNINLPRVDNSSGPISSTEIQNPEYFAYLDYIKMNADNLYEKYGIIIEISVDGVLQDYA